MYLDQLRCDLLDQMLANPDFEQGSGGWAGIDSSSLINLDSTYVQSGSTALRFDYQSQVWPGIEQFIDINPGDSYQISCYWKGENLTANSTVRLKWFDDNNQQIGSSQYVCSSSTGTFDYVNKTATVTAPAGATQLKIRAYANSGTGTIYLDNLTCTEQ